MADSSDPSTPSRVVCTLPARETLNFFQLGGEMQTRFWEFLSNFSTAISIGGLHDSDLRAWHYPVAGPGNTTCGVSVGGAQIADEPST